MQTKTEDHGSPSAFLGNRGGPFELGGDPLSWLALVESPDQVCVRYRISPFSEAFRNKVGSLEIRQIPTGIINRMRLSSSLWGTNLLLQRKLLPGWQTRMLKSRVSNLVFDFDDAVFLRDSYHPKGFYDRKRLARFQAMMEAADVVVAGNHYLAGRAREFRSHSQTYIVPTCINPSLYPANNYQREKSSPLYLVWIGSSSTLQGMENQTPLWNTIGQGVDEAIFRVICDRFPKWDSLKFEEKLWAKTTEAQDLASSHVGLSWIPDDPWSRGKCGLKVLQYMASGLPVVANPVGIHLEMITQGVNGFLCKSPEEWVDAIRWLRDNPEKARNMGQAGRAVVEERYSIRAGFQAWAKILKDLGQKKTI